MKSPNAAVSIAFVPLEDIRRIRDITLHFFQGIMDFCYRGFHKFPSLGVYENRGGAGRDKEESYYLLDWGSNFWSL